MRRDRINLVGILILCATALTYPCITAYGADTFEQPNRPEDSNGQMLEKNEKSSAVGQHGVFTPRAMELAELTGILKVYNQLRKEQEAAKKSPTTPKTLEDGFRNQRIIYLHDKLNQYFLSADLEIESTIAKLNSGMSALGDRKATLSDERARVLRRNTFINLISGGLTKIGGYSIALTPASLIPTNVLEVFDGGVQAGLSANTIKQQRDEKKFSKSTPEMLMAFVNGNSQTMPQYPANVWTYLNAKANPYDKYSRRATLIERWRVSGRLNPGGSSTKRKAPPAAPTRVVAFDDLDDTVTMLADIRAVLSGSQVALMELSETIKGVYDDDPPI